MPIYEYRCTGCNQEFEISQKITDDPLTVCASCGGELKKLITNTSFVLKGSGWYVTDYPSEARKKAIEGEKPSPPEKDSKGEKKPEAKPSSPQKAETPQPK